MTEPTTRAPRPPIGRAMSVVVLGDVSREHPIESEIADAAHEAGEKHKLDVMVASGPYYSNGDERDQKLSEVTAERDKLRAVALKIRDALHNPSLTTDGSRLIGISAVLNTLTPLTEAEIAHAQRVWREIRPDRPRPEEPIPSRSLSERTVQ